MSSRSRIKEFQAQFKKKINKKINTNLETVVEEDKYQIKFTDISDSNESNIENTNEFSDSEEEDKGLGT